MPIAIHLPFRGDSRGAEGTLEPIRDCGRGSGIAAVHIERKPPFVAVRANVQCRPTKILPWVERTGAGRLYAEAEGIKFHQELRDAYRRIAAAEPRRCLLIDASAGPEIVAANVWSALRDRFLATEVGNVASSA